MLLLGWCTSLRVQRRVFTDLGPRPSRRGCQTAGAGIFEEDAMKWKLGKLLTGFNSATGRKSSCAEGGRAGEGRRRGEREWGGGRVRILAAVAFPGRGKETRKKPCSSSSSLRGSL